MKTVIIVLIIVTAMAAVCNGRRYGFCKHYGTNVCKLPMNEGPCLAIIPRFYYDKDSQTCKEFTYGGCGGNENSFETKEECEETCGDFRPTDVCKLPKEPGPCHSMILRYYYDQQTESCKKFYYKGCCGNGNNFNTLEDCQKKCEV